MTSLNIWLPIIPSTVHVRTARSVLCRCCYASHQPVIMDTQIVSEILYTSSRGWPDKTLSHKVTMTIWNHAYRNVPYFITFSGFCKIPPLEVFPSCASKKFWKFCCNNFDDSVKIDSFHNDYIVLCQLFEIYLVYRRCLELAVLPSSGDWLSLFLQTAISPVFQIDGNRTEPGPSLVFISFKFELWPLPLIYS